MKGFEGVLQRDNQAEGFAQSTQPKGYNKGKFVQKYKSFPIYGGTQQLFNIFFCTETSSETALAGKCKLQGKQKCGATEPVSLVRNVPHLAWQGVSKEFVLIARTME